ncbi:hypothetical protein B4065_2595 [Caldibacillus thermoamylovorans]|nr:hypothetical protein B4065_2595 [Caldibacillus thermoamylovorans]
MSGFLFSFWSMEHNLEKTREYSSSITISMNQLKETGGIT